jgi:type IV pilus assembly protein PilO
MTLDDLNNLDINQIGTWPLPAKVIIILLLCAALLAAGYFLHLEEMLNNLDKVERQEGDLRKDFEVKQAKAVNLDKYKQQLLDLKESMGTMLQQLPNKTEVPALLVDVSQTGLAAGLEFKLFQPQAEVPRDFYAEYPINIEVVGNYHQFGEFISGLASLPRIVTIHNLNMQPIANSKQLTLKALAKTYRYMDEEEVAAAKPKDSKKAAAKKGGK